MQPPSSNDEPLNGPLEDRVESKNWKARVSAYQELKTLFTSALPNDPIYSQYGTTLLYSTLHKHY